jgi:hypothetical protein
MSSTRRQHWYALTLEALEDRCTPSVTGPDHTHGLLGLYYNNPYLQGAPVAQQISPDIDILYKLQNGKVVTETPRMANGLPVGGYGENNFSVVWGAS